MPDTTPKELEVTVPAHLVDELDELAGNLIIRITETAEEVSQMYGDSLEVKATVAYSVAEALINDLGLVMVAASDMTQPYRQAAEQYTGIVVKVIDGRDAEEKPSEDTPKSLTTWAVSSHTSSA